MKKTFFQMNWAGAVLVGFGLLAPLASAQSLDYPETRKVDHIDTYHGIRVADPYRWLEQLFSYPRYSAPFRRGEYFFFFKNDGLQNQSVLYIQKGLNGTPELFLDPGDIYSFLFYNLGVTPKY